MKILVYGINYSPELTGIGKYTGEMCEWLATRGHEVEVITSMPYYPEWEIHEKYKRKWWHSEIINGVKICRTPFYVPQKVTGFSRIIHELSFVINTSVFWLPRFFQNYDVVIGICPPLQAGIFPWLYKVFRRKPFIFHIQDLQVDAARELGLIKNKILLNFLEKTEKFLLQKATRVSSISEGMKKRLLDKGFKEENYISLPNWVDTDFIKPISGDIPLKAELGFHKMDKIILYSGSMGEKQGLEVVINIAERLRHDTSLFFVFSGDGPAKKKLQKLGVAKGLINVKFIQLQPYGKLPELLSMADLNLVLQKKAASDIVLPSKLVTILSAGGIAIVTATSGSTLYDLIKKNNIGVLVDPENEQALFDSIEEYLYSDHNLLKERARDYAINQLNINKILSNFELTLSGLNRMSNK